MSTRRQWRAISRTLTHSKKWRQVDNDARVLYIALQLRSDSFGCIEADPDHLSVTCLPSVDGWGEDEIRIALRDLVDAKLVRLYDRDHEGNELDRTWLEIIDFDDHQPFEFLRKRGKRSSPIPHPQDADPAAALGRRNSGAGRSQNQEPRTQNRSIGMTTSSLVDAGPRAACDDDGEVDEVTVDSDDVRAVFDHWLRTCVDARQHGRTKLTDDRRRKIKARLKEGYTVADLCKAIDGFAADPWHRGEHPQNRTPRLGLVTLIKNASKVDDGIARAEKLGPPKTKPGSHAAKEGSRVRAAAHA